MSYYKVLKKDYDSLCYTVQKFTTTIRQTDVIAAELLTRVGLHSNKCSVNGILICCM